MIVSRWPQQILALLIGCLLVGIGSGEIVRLNDANFEHQTQVGKERRIEVHRDVAVRNSALRHGFGRGRTERRRWVHPDEASLVQQATMPRMIQHSFFQSHGHVPLDRSLITFLSVHLEGIDRDDNRELVRHVQGRTLSPLQKAPTGI